eukprot:CAMPEP_0197178624 /NCGR_PEP_ID=MMETSP1423-20130617/3849_1 /TAXON_ID=476441 /ORGANISM="Pseudo-nitzschia heimii, Strain UNC1101" /LENGTH=334 /DNA_ID=CAMNT_0042628401 /DNA_START=321 /DNA_END=1325 /DNA_ORIENTATION=+
MNTNFHHEQINALNVPSNVVDAMNNASKSRVQKSIFVPDINASLSNTNGRPQNHNATFSTGSTLQDRNAFTMAKRSSTSLNVGGSTVDEFNWEQSGIMNGSLWNVETALNGRTKNINIESTTRGLEDREISSLPFPKRMRHSRQKDSITQQVQQQTLISSIPFQYGNTSGRSFSLFVERDERNLSQYQCLARKQMEIFEASLEDAAKNAQGRNRPILPGQIGIRCRHCYKLPPKQRKTGSVYYPNRLEGVYQTAQKMTVGHICKHCTMIPQEIRERLLFLKDQKSSDGGGKRYWANCVRSLGVIETPHDGLTFAEPLPNTLKRESNANGYFKGE